MTRGLSPSMTAMQEFVVPWSMPTETYRLAIVWVLLFPTRGRLGRFGSLLYRSPLATLRWFRDKAARRLNQLVVDEDGGALAATDTRAVETRHGLRLAYRLALLAPCVLYPTPRGSCY